MSVPTISLPPLATAERLRMRVSFEMGKLQASFKHLFCTADRASEDCGSKRPQRDETLRCRVGRFIRYENCTLARSGRPTAMAGAVGENGGTELRRVSGRWLADLLGP